MKLCLLYFKYRIETNIRFNGTMNKLCLEECSIDALKVDTNKLNSILGHITTTISRHEKILNKVTQIEESQYRIQKDLSLFLLNKSSRESFESVIVTDENHSSGYATPVDHGEAKENTSSARPRGMSIKRLQAVSDAAQKIEKSLVKSTVSDLRKDIVGLKAIVSQLQQELNIEIVHSSEIEFRIEILNSTVTSLEDQHGPAATSAEVQRQREFMANKVDALSKAISDVETATQFVVNSKMNEKLMEMKSWFSDLESMIRSKQSQLNNKLSLFAQNSELIALQENMNNEFIDQKSRIDFLERSIISNEDTLFQMKQHSSILSFHKIHKRWKERMIEAALNRWKRHNEFVLRHEHEVIQRKKNIRKALIRTWFAKKSNAWRKWHHFILWHKKLEVRRDNVMRNIIERMQLRVSEPSRLAFNKWRRTIIGLKIQKCKIDDATSDDESTSRITQRAFSGNECNKTESVANQYDLSTLLESFCSDKDGAIQTLAQEINNIKTFDIRRARRETETKIQEMENRFDQIISKEVSDIQIREREIESNTDLKFESLSSQLSQMKKDIAEMRNSLHGTINRVKVIEQTHRDRIELLFEDKELIEEEIMSLKKKFSSIQSSLKNLEYSNDHSQNTIKTLLQNMKDFESFYKGHKESTDLKNDQLNKTLAAVSKDLTRIKRQNEKLNDDLADTRHNLIQSKVSSDSSLREIHGILDTHGVSQPKLLDIIEQGGLFERKSKETNYVVPINFAVDGRPDLDIASNIAAFAQDYACWIAFEADHDALKLVVIGKNGEEDGCIEDNTDVMRNTLVER